MLSRCGCLAVVRRRLRDAVTSLHVQRCLVVLGVQLNKHGRVLHVRARGALRVVRDQHNFVITNIFYNFVVLALLIGLGPGAERVVIVWRTVHDLAKEVSVTVEHLLGGDSVRLLLGVSCVLLHFEEVVGLEEHEVDLFKDLVVYVN